MDISKSDKITYERLIEVLDYNRDTGIFVWKINKSKWERFKAGPIAGSNKNGYIEIYIDQKKYQASTLAWLYVYKKYPSHRITHIDKNRSNNKIENLKKIVKQEYKKKPRLSKNNKSGVNGLFFHEKRKNWVAQIMINKKNITIGYFSEYDKDSAVMARYKAEIKYGYWDKYHTSQAYLYLKERELI